MIENPVDAAHLRKTIREFEEVTTLTTREQEELVKLLVSKVVHDGVPQAEAALDRVRGIYHDAEVTAYR